MKYDKQTNQKIIVAGKSIEYCQCKIIKELVHENALYVLFDVYGVSNKDSVNNVWKVNEEGDVLWKIEGFPKNSKPDPYTNILLKEGQLMAYNWAGYTFSINTETGEILESQNTKPH